MNAQRETADELIARARRVHAACASYADEGTLSTRYEQLDAPASHSHEQQLRFRTRWVRPASFLFEFEHSLPSPPGESAPQAWMRYAVWTTPGAARSWWTLKPEGFAHDSLEHALAAALGVSCGTSWRMASLLGAVPSGSDWFPEPGGCRGDPARSEDAECLRIPQRVHGQDHALWIERDSGLLRRYDECREFGAQFLRAQHAEHLRRIAEAPLTPSFSAEDRARMLRSLEAQSKQPIRPFRTHSTTIYRPRLDPELRPEELVFVPPSGS